MNQLISRLIKSNYKCIIVECGHGSMLSNTFLSEPGASKLVLLSKQPYSKEIQRIEYPKNNGIRSVSKEFVYNVMQTELLKYNSEFKDDKLLVLVSSFQLGSDNTICHGYFGLGYTNGIKNYYTISHLTYYEKQSLKNDWINKIYGDLMSLININIYNNGYGDCANVDGCWDYNNDKEISSREFLLELNSNSNQNENFLCFSPNMDMIRFEDIIRLNKGDKQGIILQKGSYNPFHKMHENIAKNACESYPNYPHVLVLSTNTCDKGEIDISILYDRIKKLTTLGYHVIVTKNGLFHENVKWIRNYYNDLHIIFPVGEDTIERFFRDWTGYFDNPIEIYVNDFKDVDWLITNRKSQTKEFGELIFHYQKYINNFKFTDLPMDDISSTRIRSGEIKNNLVV